ncbi:MAG TPA: efflux RND transporter periplasmic adaptor subunit [Polyangiaceae bacterium]|nr:efflux RND transporter periplasmic adaptor subunit [Polyangiaceae bacterium]
MSEALATAAPTMGVQGAHPVIESEPPPRNGAPLRRPTSKLGARGKKLGVAALAVVLVAGASVGVWRYTVATRAAPVRYETAALSRGALSAKVTASGNVSALVTVQVGSQVSGRIETLGADYNSRVKKGQVIATIEPSLFKAALAQARANATAAAADVESARTKKALALRQRDRAEQLYADGLLSKSDLETSRANLDVAKAQQGAAEAQASQARAALDQAALNLKYTTIVSPIDGVVISRNVDVGQTVAATLQAPTLFTIAQDLSKMQVDTSVAESDVGKVRDGMKVTFTVDAYPSVVFEGNVRQVRNAPQTVQNVVTYDAVIDVDNREGRLKPGMTATVTFTYAEVADALLVPNAAFRFKPDPKTVTAMLPKDAALPPRLDLDREKREIWILDGGKPENVVVQIGLSDGSKTEVLGGDLRDGDRVITEAALVSP